MCRVTHESRCRTGCHGYCFLVSDTLLLPLQEIKGNPTGPVNGEFHGLKIQILDPHVAVAFATSNDTHACLTIINEIRKDLQRAPNIAVERRVFEEYQKIVLGQSGGPDCEFLVMRNTLDEKKLWHVTKEGVFPRSRAFIGDRNEYIKLLDLLKPHHALSQILIQQPDGTFTVEPLSETTGQIEFAQVSFAMETLLHKRPRTVGGIAGCVVRVVDARISKELEYLQSMEVSHFPWEPHSGFSVLASNSGTRGIGIYYRTGKVGFLMIVGDYEYCRKEHVTSLSEFIELGRARYGLDLVGGTW